MGGAVGVVFEVAALTGATAEESEDSAHVGAIGLALEPLSW